MVGWGEGQHHSAEIWQPRAHPETKVGDYLKGKAASIYAYPVFFENGIVVSTSRITITQMNLICVLSMLTKPRIIQSHRQVGNTNEQSWTDIEFMKTESKWACPVQN